MSREQSQVYHSISIPPFCIIVLKMSLKYISVFFIVVVLTAVNCYASQKNSLWNSKLFKLSGGSTATSAHSSSDATVTNKMKLIYFNGRGVAELARIILKINHVDFIDERFSATMDNGKFLTPEFDQLKTTGELHPNMNRLPILITDSGLSIGQSKTIERYLATKYNLMGKNEHEYFQIDNIVENIKDIKDKYIAIRRIGGMNKPSEERDIALKKWFDEGELQSWLEKLEKSVPTPSSQTKTSYTVGNSLSYADLIIWQFLCDYFDEKYSESVKSAYKNCPRLSSIVSQVSTNADLQNWLKERPVTIF